MYSIEQFKKEFINYKFDKILHNQNNELVNSNKHYLEHKNKYLENTNKNLNELTTLIQQYNILNNYYIKHDNNKYSYTIIDTSLKNDINNNIKKIMLEQKQNFTHFINYINFLNTNNNIQINNIQKNNIKSRMIQPVINTKRMNFV